jgi:hypothetical protein
MVHMGKRSQAVRRTAIDQVADRRKTVVYLVVFAIVVWFASKAFIAADQAAAPAVAAVATRAQALEAMERQALGE